MNKKNDGELKDILVFWIAVSDIAEKYISEGG